MGGNPGVGPLQFNPSTNAVIRNVPGLTASNTRDQAASVLLPPAQHQKVMIMGGGDPATNAVAIADLSLATPTYASAAPLHYARMHLNAVVLPDRTVFVSGGSGHSEDMMTAVLQSEIYHPASDAWSVTATATVARLYHSVALLLPDGRVITAGSNPARKNDELRLELFHPPYLFKGPRPFIEAVPKELTYGQLIEIHSPQAADIKWVSLIRPSTTTHSCDTGQRLVDVPFRRHGFCHLEANIPNEPSLAPPGWYMLFITDQRGIPSIARWIHLRVPDSLAMPPHQGPVRVESVLRKGTKAPGARKSRRTRQERT